jgi:predicted Fe-Mo cluster-binding NifX family protein
MKVAIAVREGEIATTLDFARQVLVVECEGGKEVRRARFAIGETLPVNRARRLTQLGAQVLICGAISRPLAALMVDSGIRVVPLVSGEVEEVLAAFLSDQLSNPHFLLAGCTPKDREDLMFHGQA